MRQDLHGKVALVTGASGGIGRVVAKMLDRLGMRVALLGRSEEKLAQVRAALENDAIVFPGELMDFQYLDEVMRAIEARFGRLDVLINNAGVALSCPFEAVTFEQFDNIMKTNAYAPYFVTQKALALLRKSDCATVVQVTSVVGHKGYPLQSAYVASKHASYGIAKALANELYQENIRFHVVSPGGVYTDMIKKARPDLSADGLIMPEEIADTIEFLITHRGNAMIDEIELHRVGKAPFA